MADGMFLWLDRYRAGKSDPVSKGAVNRANSLGIGSDEVLQRYRGFEGKVLASDPSRIPPRPDGEAVDLIRAIGLSEGGQPSDIEYGKLLGFDAGIFESAFNQFSMVFHEVLFGRDSALASFGTKLNESCLLPSQELAAEYLRVRRLRIEEGAALEAIEDSEGPHIFAIFEPQREGN